MGAAAVTGVSFGGVAETFVARNRSAVGERFSDGIFGRDRADHSALMLAARITLPHVSSSVAMPAAEQREKRTAFHSITSSARARSVGGTSSPSALAALRLITSSYLVGAWTGRSAGFSPLRMRST